MFQELDKLTATIIDLKRAIVLKNEIFLKIKAVNCKPNPDNEKFFKDLESYSHLYSQKLIGLNQGLNFYNEFNTRLNELNSRVTDFLLARDIEKNEIIKAITSGNNYNMNNNNQGYSKYFY